jgi:hypothetical protein
MLKRAHEYVWFDIEFILTTHDRLQDPAVGMLSAAASVFAAGCIRTPPPLVKGDPEMAGSP